MITVAHLTLCLTVFGHLGEHAIGNGVPPRWRRLCRLGRLAVWLVTLASVLIRSLFNS